MLLLSWNVRFQSLSSKLDAVVSAIESARPDIVTLQEVKTELGERLVERLASIGLGHALDVLSCGYFHEWREAGWSDHSAMWTNLRLNPVQPPLVEWDCAGEIVSEEPK